MEHIQLNGIPFIKNEIDSDGQIVLPRFTADEKVGLTTMTGSVIFNIDTNKIEYYNGSSWKEINWMI